MRKFYPVAAIMLVMLSCNKVDLRINKGGSHPSEKESTTFTEIGSVDLGEEGASEISAYDPLTKRLFVVNNADVNKIDVVDLSNPASPIYVSSIRVAPFGGLVNSVAVYGGKLAAAIEATTKTNNGKAVIFNTTDYSVIAIVNVGALPDMITWSPDGELIVTANEGEPNDDYTIDPIGTVSLINVKNNYSVNTLDFSSFSSQQSSLMARGLRIFGPGASFAQDIEPEYVAISANSKTAYVTLQENNAVATIDLKKQMITDIFPLGFKNYNVPANAMDLSDKDGGIQFNTWPVKGMYQPDGITVIPGNGTPFFFTANEGDARDYDGYSEQIRVKDASIVLDPVAFPNTTNWKDDAILGRLNITNTLGDTDGDGDYDELYSYGALSFSIWNGNTGEQVYDSGDEIDKITSDNGAYPDSRSDDKGSEPEGVTIGRIENTNLLFVGTERANGIFVYDIINPTKPRFMQWLQAGEGPEGLQFVEAALSPAGKSLLIVSNETEGVVKIFSTL